MSDQKTQGNAKYETPILVPLGALAKGSGVCTTGSSVVDNGGTCAPGSTDGAVTGCSAGTADGEGGGGACAPGAADGGTGPIDCTAGATATQDCTAGPTATRDCTAGTNALRACTAGTAALDACTGGSSHMP